MYDRREDSFADGISLTDIVQLFKRMVGVVDHVYHLVLMKDSQLGSRVSYIYNKVHVYFLIS